MGLDPPCNSGRRLRELRPHAPGGDEYQKRGVLIQPPGVQHSLLQGNGHRGQGSAGGIQNRVTGETIGLDFRVNALPRAEHFELQARCWQPKDTYN